jgi:hypothetical protein
MLTYAVLLHYAPLSLFKVATHTAQWPKYCNNVAVLEGAAAAPRGCHKEIVRVYGGTPRTLLAIR